ncbi:hypothetical protein A2276_05000 [candidate division WOR-1 bacterium RIFOXYA12_FULL_43_27]|uniref:Uncharacterized protein n=1 Tax=candidate division WOR-1 bacterium RIFOXYC2_FULL_46_14 TaxID=1802587 RepID=A0A1F4UA30_UNCSA|nr:MAG: hypothetical protein A2276_05000 [candidate division WOR-1 bacterium RIFOXYA12_FULL_43_27]OGC20024.1 MAG: hypothetical protein A2292_03005 [candidate division WOR-1 bacterium RIFOXYB2_FULL_46_45]OGC32239.1 MAG: hypothetical protein A2232_08440 [candidate division WOR-1 bacterium RIFOXYA2_FULL_46_56]OGC41143.1 MAG: hypothetical protein A2438_07380 [candidate division WOR-1 bacterium RIFOXYC2_FULL_46_14]
MTHVFNIDQIKPINRHRPIEIDNESRALSEELKGLKYIPHQEIQSVGPQVVVLPQKPEAAGVQNVRTTEHAGGGDCDDLALKAAYERNKTAPRHIEYGVISGYSEKVPGKKYDGHAVMAKFNKRERKFYLYEVADPANPHLIGSFSAKQIPSKSIPQLKTGEFVRNVYFGVTKDGKPDFTKKRYFVPAPKDILKPLFRQIEFPTLKPENQLG